MNSCARLLTILLAAASPIGAAQAQHSAPAPASAPASAIGRPTDALTLAFEAAERGELGPLRQGLNHATGDVRALIAARLAAARLDLAATRNPVLARLAAGNDPALKRAALRVLSGAAFGEGDYVAAARHGRALAEALAAAGMTDEAEGAERAWGIATLLAGQPRQRLAGPLVPGSAPARVDRVGLPRVDVAVNGETLDAIFDTGANLSVLSAETARRLGVRILDGAASVGNSIQGSVGTRVGIAQRLEIAGARLENVVFLVIDDAQLSFQIPGGAYEIKAILGLPVMRALGRMRMEPTRLSLLGPMAGAAPPPNMHASGPNLYVDAVVGGRAIPLYLDTGANRTSLSTRFAATYPEAVTGLPTTETQQGGAGGMRRRRSATWADADVALAGRTLRLPALPIELPQDADRQERDYGTIGATILRAFESWTLDLNAMRFELGAPVPVPVPVAAPAAGSWQ